ncbi:hypothetical protein [Sporosalibacterium faouarense]|uniref:hypothetical protein n=1 Tax=Sporosalibacterium faouarense TaxID=516123 RepID=UPI00141D13E4|nr:hypothetical protein [Sporosalibacterium faouarense]MTI48667.1 hypothetical protein [Bacillota bacterium]
MVNISKQLLKILSAEVFQRIINNDVIRLEQLMTAQALLIEANIPYDLVFAAGTRRDASAVELIIYINPTTTMNFTVAFEAGGTTII